MNMMPILQLNSPPSLAEGLSPYLQRINSIPLLSEDEETELFHRLHKHNDLEAAGKIIMAHLRFVANIAKRYEGYGLPLEDLIQEGNIGMMKSVKRFDLSKGVRLASFALHWIKAEIHEYVLRNWRLVKVATTKAQRKLFFNLITMKKQLEWLSKKDAEEVAQDLDVDVSQVYDMDARLYQHDCYFDPSFGDHLDEEGDGYTAQTVYLEDHSMRPDLLIERHRHNVNYPKLLNQALLSLDKRSRTIIFQRWLDEEKVTLQELANEYGISLARISKIEKAAMRKIRNFLENKSPGYLASQIKVH